ncbi:MAG: 16S rRNA (cytosine(1402)-N(4))-methyltransferase [Gemmataceae bacterium]
MSPPPKHVPVLADEVIRLADPQPGQTWVDCTVGGGGHTKLLAERLGDTGRLIGLDQDATMLERARTVLSGPGHAGGMDPTNWPKRRRLEDRRAWTRCLQTSGSPGPDGTTGAVAEFPRHHLLDMRLNSNRDRPPRSQELDERGVADMFFEFGEEGTAAAAKRSSGKVKSSTTT